MIRYYKYLLSVMCFLTLLLSGGYAHDIQHTPTLVTSPDSLNSVIEKELSIIVSKLLSPNGDGVNDYWHIQGIDKYPDNRVVIYNRWGDKISIIKNYNNSSVRWDGKDNNGKFIPDGTYYYVLEIRKEHRTLNGWVYLIQK